MVCEVWLSIHLVMLLFSLNPSFNGTWSASLKRGQEQSGAAKRLNPSFNGTWSARVTIIQLRTTKISCLNPSFNGMWSASAEVIY